MNSRASALPPHAASALARARECLQGGDTAQAQHLCHEVLNACPDQAEAEFMLGLIDLHAARPEAALQRLQSALRAVPDNLDVQAALGGALAALSRHKEAADVYAAVLERAPAAIDVRARYAVALQEAGEVTQAIDQYRLALAARPQDAFLHFSLGTAHKRLHDFDAAIDAYKRAAALAPQDVHIAYGFAVALMERSRMAEAAAAFESVVALDGQIAQAWCYLGYTRIRCGHAQGAIEAAREYARLAGDDSDADDLLCNALLSGGDADGALQKCDEILARAPARIQALADRSIALAAKGRGSEARALVNFDGFLSVSHIDAPPGFDDLQSFHAALIEHLRTHPQLRFDFNSISCHNGQTSGEILVEPKGPVAALEAIVTRAGESYRERLGQTLAVQAGDAPHPWLQGAPSETQLSAWCTVLRSQGYQHGHIHPTSWLSGVYYLRLPTRNSGASDDASQRAGWIEFGRAPDHYPAGDQGEIRYLEPQPGTLVLFPSYVYHRTIAFDSDDERVTIAFDFRPPGDYEN